MKVLKFFLEILFIGVLFVLFICFIREKESSDKPIINLSEDYVKQNSKKITVIIDAGHGGIDGGAIAYDGTLEKDMNLEYAMELERILVGKGVETVMTRRDDALLSGEGRDRKTRDLRARLDIAERTDNGLFVSIHMNKFYDSAVRGATVYYSPNHKDGKIIAQMLSEYLKKNLPTAGERPVKAADSSIYILKRITKPAILVECGFISNKEEKDLLSSKEYKEALMSALADTIISYLDG